MEVAGAGMAGDGTDRPVAALARFRPV